MAEAHLLLRSACSARLHPTSNCSSRNRESGPSATLSGAHMMHPLLCSQRKCSSGARRPGYGQAQDLGQREAAQAQGSSGRSKGISQGCSTISPGDPDLGPRLPLGRGPGRPLNTVCLITSACAVAPWGPGIPYCTGAIVVGCKSRGMCSCLGHAAWC